MKTVRKVFYFRCTVLIIMFLCVWEPLWGDGQFFQTDRYLHLEHHSFNCYVHQLLDQHHQHHQDLQIQSKKDSTNIKRYIAHSLVAAGFIGYLTYGYYVFWQNFEYQEFYISDWNDTHQRSYAGGSDKFSHAFGGYFMTRTISQLYSWSGKEKRSATWLGFWFSQAFLMFGELEDGFTLVYGFDPVDLVSNIGGGLIGVIEELNPSFDEFFDFRISYWPSDEYHKQSDFDNIAEDYSGQTFYFVGKLPKSVLSSRLSWLRYFECYIGFKTKGYMPGYDHSSQDQIEGSTRFNKQRNIVYGISFNIREIFDTMIFRGKRDRFRSLYIGTDYLFEFYQHPLKIGGSSILSRYPYYYVE